MVNIAKKIMLIGCLMVLFSCQNSGGNGQAGGVGNIFTGQNIGGILGSAGGAWGGSKVGGGSGRTTAIAVGTLLGSQLGQALGSYLTNKDLNYYNNSSQGALSNFTNGQTASWSNPQTGNEGTVTPIKTYNNSQGQQCRDFQQSISVAGEEIQTTGTACKQRNGTWKLVN